MQLNERNLIKMQSIIKEHQFEHAADYLIEHMRQGIRLSKKGVEDYARPCHSRIGGDPDLPEEIEWPLTSDGTPMTFLAQLQLRDVAAHDATASLPLSGMLYFFIGVDEPAYNIEHRVLYLTEDQTAAAVRRQAPEETTLEEEFTGHRIEARATLEPPNYAYVDDEIVEDEEHDFESYEDLCHQLTGLESDDIAMIFGYPSTQHGDCEHEAALMLLTGSEYNYSMEAAMQQITDHCGGNAAQAQQEIRDTLLLLAIDSDDDVGFCWWDAGELQFYIRKEDLLAGNFERTYCSLYSS
ncbi:YwqG family protein [Paenibacillus sp. JZ16]|uniref:YwqG family protein n=1 Tax=Paenibacillus sp. JZ16 TaxID=1906272 RepID=UPI00188D6880|nr:YwqG family protein [Paenibacillus sp. JZ16]